MNACIQALPERLPQRLSSRIDLDPSGCWLWLGGQNGNGYGRVSWQRSRARRR